MVDITHSASSDKKRVIFWARSRKAHEWMQAPEVSISVHDVEKYGEDAKAAGLTIPSFWEKSL
jgi:hypothetical protein